MEIIVIGGAYNRIKTITWRRQVLLRDKAKIIIIFIGKLEAGRKTAYLPAKYNVSITVRECGFWSAGRFNFIPNWNLL
jgi:hypothetical protein